MQLPALTKSYTRIGLPAKMTDKRLESLRSTMMDGDGLEEKVEVNQRHLIDKILARYSAEYVLYRELMQNADDALSTAVQIEFRSQNMSAANNDPSKPPNLSAKCEKIVFKNNGQQFRPEDWARLKKIAEGNPDEQKIGAFGVGFYSLFSICENPFVFSGSQCMAFYFKGDQLFAKRADVPEPDRDDWTSFLMDLREPMEMPELNDFARFLATSMGFTANLRQITVRFDQHIIFKIEKRRDEPQGIPVDTKAIRTSSPRNMFTITGADMRRIQLNAEKYSQPSGLFSFTSLMSSKQIDNSSGLPMEKASIFLRVVTGSLKVNVPRDYEREMERATKKKPPKTTSFQLVYTGREEIEASENSSDIFKDLIPFPHQGRVFIGFPTHQTTGCSSHMAARFIPTVERESIDFADRYISVWNKELLAIGGILCRIVYNNEVEQIDRFFRELVGHKGMVDKANNAKDDAMVMLDKRAAHALRSFTFQHSTPSPIVGKLQEQCFFESSKVPPRLMSSHGIQPATSIRTLPPATGLSGPQMNDLLNTFIKTIPTISDAVAQECDKSIEKLKKYDYLKVLDVADVLNELDTRPLTENEMVACMQWWIQHNKSNSVPPPTTKRLLESAILSINGERLQPLASVQWWINPKVVPLDVPVPDATLPFSISKHFSPPDLSAYFGEWHELSLLEWVRFVSERDDFQTTAPFAEKMLSIIARGYSHISSKSQADICSILKEKSCIPTKYGMKKPYESYFPNVNLFDDLPVIHFTNAKAMHEQLLAALGVRKHVELQLVFDRLISDGSWSHVDLIKYLTSIQSTLTQTELRRLRETAIFTKEGEEPKIKEYECPTGEKDDNGKPVMRRYSKRIFRRYKACDLFAPLDTLRALKLPLLDWTGRWRPSSDEAHFLEKLGLATFPSVSQILTLASPATGDKQLQNAALKYFIENYKQYETSYKPVATDIAFLPCSDGKTYAAPRDCFTNPSVRILDFNVLHTDLFSVREKLGVRENPDPERIVNAFLSHITKDQDTAKRIFEYMASRLSDLDNTHLQNLRQSKFIPVVDSRTSSSHPEVILVEPGQCYFESGESSFHKQLFLYVDFGSLANSFLRNCGVKDEPTTVELASMIVKDPARFWTLSGGGERYLGVLRQIAGQFYQIRSNRKLLQDMKSSPFLVGIQKSRISESPSLSVLNNDQKEDDNSKTEEFVQYRLAKASDIFIIDDTMAQQIFSPLSAPMEPLLEEFYVNLGSDYLSRQINESYTYRDAMGVTNRSKAITDAIFERTPIIIYQMMSDNPQRQKELCHDERYVKRNLKVIQARELKINRKFIHTGEQNVQPTTACADRSSFTIYVTGVGEIDYYDVANALCSLLFKRVRFNDAIVVERYLTASLNHLRHKGVPVDRILNIRKNVEKAGPPLPINSQIPPPQQTPVPTLTKSQMDQCTRKVLEVFSDCQEGYVRQLLSQERENHVENVINRLLHEDYPRSQQSRPSAVVKEEQNKPRNPATEGRREDSRRSTLLSRLWSSWSGTKQQESESREQTTPETFEPAPQTPRKPRLPDSEGTITPNYTSNIRQNLKRAIHSCKPYSGHEVFTPPRINKVVESNSYCDVRPQHNLVSAGTVMGLEFYVHRGIDPEDVRQEYGQAMQRFISIATVLASVFELKPASLHIFYDTQGSTIAFNMSGSLFLNLRYYLALHEPSKTDDEAHRMAKRKEALIYWFMTVCHELAHNFVSDHSSEHEFYMSSFAEVYLEFLIPYLTTTNNTPPPTALSS